MFQRGRLALVTACAALLLVSCGSVGQPANADEPTNAPETPRSSASEGATIVLVDLHDAGAAATWTTVNDPVMGGKSTSTITSGNGGLVFAGDLSLENNGGFASARSQENPDIGRKATAARSLRVRAVGDGKTYLLKLGTAGLPYSYIQRFVTEAGVARSYDLPIEGFAPVGQRLDPAPDAPEKLDPSTISQVSVYILDQQQGPFRITVNEIDAIT